MTVTPCTLCAGSFYKNRNNLKNNSLIEYGIYDIIKHYKKNLWGVGYEMQKMSRSDCGRAQVMP